MFSNKVRDIDDHRDLVALFSAMFSISSRFDPAYENGVDLASGIPSHQQFHSLSIAHINMALVAYSSCAPPLCILQAMTLASFYMLGNGVHGQAWRLLGSAVRVAYESRLHLIDYGDGDEVPDTECTLARWSLAEERRRCWWTLWEMDLFASTIQRCPTAIEWKMNETYLPISDDQWFANKYQSSCKLQREPEERWKKLRDCGNRSSAAWYIVISSIMRDAQVLCYGNIQGIFSNLTSEDNIPTLVEYFRHAFRAKASEEDSKQLTALVNAYHGTINALPENLCYRGERLTFGINEYGDGDASLLRRTCAAKYNIWMAAELTRFMINHHDVFAGIVNGVIPESFDDTESREGPNALKKVSLHTNALNACLRASDNIALVLTNCVDGHVQFVNPFMASVVWLAAALQIYRKLFTYNHNPILTQNKFEVLRSTYVWYVNVWGAPPRLIQDLDSLQMRLATRLEELNWAENKGNMLQHWRGQLPTFQNSTGTGSAISQDDPVRRDLWKNQGDGQAETSPSFGNDISPGYGGLIPESYRSPASFSNLNIDSEASNNQIALTAGIFSSMIGGIDVDDFTWALASQPQP